MIHITLGYTQSQILPMTINELLPCGTTCSQPVIYIKNELTNKSKYFLADDLSDYQTRINLFQVYVVANQSDEDLLHGELYFTNRDIGTWTYKVYNAPCTMVGIELDELQGILEIGYLKISEL